MNGCTVRKANLFTITNGYKVFTACQIFPVPREGYFHELRANDTAIIQHPDHLPERTFRRGINDSSYHLASQACYQCMVLRVHYSDSTNLDTTSQSYCETLLPCMLLPGSAWTDRRHRHCS